MKKILFVMSVVALSIFNLSAKEEVLVDGVKAGQWTMDYEAAKSYAKEKGLPLILNFTGSDWCSWCIKMEEQVFSQEKWSTYAKENAVTVFIDFPQDKSKVPEKYVERNVKLRDSFEVRAYPTYIILDGDSGEKIGQLGASQDSTADSFISQMKDITRYTAQELKKLLTSVEADQKGKVQAFTNDLGRSQKDLIKLDEDYAKRRAELIQKLSSAKSEIKLMQEKQRLKKLGYTKEETEKYVSLLKDETKAQAELDSWLATRPERSEANMMKYQIFNERLKEIRLQLSEF